tara:strand:+ start:284 stop:607 length:324 start_codon:yes stop_codon:yes gene_type:complete
VKKSFKLFISYGLSVLILSGILHADASHIKEQNGYTFCDTNCDDEHHSSFHKCEQCLVTINGNIIKENIHFFSNENTSNLYDLDEVFNQSKLNYKSNSRPPPDIFFL